MFQETNKALSDSHKTASVSFLNLDGLRRLTTLFGGGGEAAGPSGATGVATCGTSVSQRHRITERAWELLLSSVVDLMSEAFQRAKEHLLIARRIEASSASPQHYAQTMDVMGIRSSMTSDDPAGLTESASNLTPGNGHV